MKRLGQIIAALQLGVLLSGWAQQPEPPPSPAPDAARHYHLRDRRGFGQDVVVNTNEVVGDLVLFGGSADVRGTVEGEIVMIGGSLKISGEVTRGVVLIGGDLELSGNIGRDAVVILGGGELKEGAQIEGSSVLVGGPFEIAPGADILGERVTVPLGDVLPKVQWFKAWVVHGLLWGRLLPLGVTWPWVVAGFSLLMYFLLLVIFPGSVKSTYTVLEQRPIASLVAGLLALVLGAPLVTILAITVVGILAIPFVALAFILAFLVGKVAVICFLGRALGGRSRAPILAFILGAILLTVVYALPVFGILVWAIATVFGLGAALVALGNSLGREESQISPVPVPRSTLEPEPAALASSNAPGSFSPGQPGSENAGASSSIPAATLPPPAVSGPLTASDVLLLRRAGFWRRSVAAVLDLILLSLTIPVIGPFFIPLAILYFVIMWTWKGTTVGSIVLGLKIIRTDGRPVNFAVALVRSLSSLFSGVVLFLGFLWAAWDREKQSWHDKIAGTVVVRMPKDFALI